MENVLEDVQATYLSLDAQYSVLLAGCRNQDERDALGVQYATAQQNYQTALNKMLSDDDPVVAALDKQLKAANLLVVRATLELGNISAVIDNITTAIALGSTLVKKDAAGTLLL